MESGSHGLLQRDLESQPLELAYRPLGRLLTIALLEVVLAQVLIHSAVLEQVVDDDQDGVSHCDDGPVISALAPAPALQPSVLSSHVAVLGPDGGSGGFDQGVPEPGIAMASACAATLATALVIARTDLGPGCAMAMAWPGAHVRS